MNIGPVLIVDDDQVDRYILKRLITRSGISDNVFEKNDGRDALEFLADYEENCKKYPGKFPPVLIFLDINMPIMNGFEFLEHFQLLRKEKNFSNSTLIMFTSSEREDDKAKALSYNFVKGYIHKMPESPSDFKSKVSDIMV